MAVNFAALEDRAARAVLRHLSNARASGLDRSGAAVSFDVVFDDAHASALEMEASRPQVLALSTQVVALQHQTALLITRKGEASGTSYVVATQEPDGTGMTTLQLERAP
jgi:hypothetical protein